MKALPRARIGISGWTYPQWRGVFYPRGLRQADELHYASRVFPSIELNGFASGLLCLRQKLGPILWQLPPSVRFDQDLLRSFFDLLPKTLRETEVLARRHDARLNGRAAVDAEENDRPLFHALEVRHESFCDPRYLDLLKAYGIASCVADTAGGALGRADPALAGKWAPGVRLLRQRRQGSRPLRRAEPRVPADGSTASGAPRIHRLRDRRSPQ